MQKGSMPRLVPEEKKPRWAEQTQEFLVAGREKLANGKQLLAAVTDYLKDLKMLPLLFFLILFFGAQFFIRSRNYTPLRQQVVLPAFCSFFKMPACGMEKGHIFMPLTAER
jgi:hypothetical protein